MPRPLLSYPTSLRASQMHRKGVPNTWPPLVVPHLNRLRTGRLWSQHLYLPCTPTPSPLPSRPHAMFMSFSRHPWLRPQSADLPESRAHGDQDKVRTKRATPPCFFYPTNAAVLSTKRSSESAFMRMTALTEGSWTECLWSVSRITSCLLLWKALADSKDK